MIRSPYKRLGAHTLLAIVVTFGACTTPSRPSNFRQGSDVADAASVFDDGPASIDTPVGSDDVFDDLTPDTSDAARDAAVPPVAGQPLTLLADLAVGDAEIIEAALGEDGVLVVCGARRGVLVVDARDPTALRPYPTVTTSFNGANYLRCTHVTRAGSVAYMTFRADSTMPSSLVAVELSATPTIVAAQQAPAGQVFESAVVIGGLVVVAMHQDGLGVFERAGGAFVRRATLGGFTNAQGLSLDGATLYVADGEGGVAVVDVRDPVAPRIVGRVATGGLAQTIAVDGVHRTAYVSAGSAGLVVVDVTRPEAPALAGRVAIGGPIGQLTVEGGRLFVAAWRDVRVYALDDPRRPTLVGVARPTQGDRLARVMGVAARGDLVAVADWNHLETWRFHPGHAAPYLETAPEPLALGRVAAGATTEAFVVVENLGRVALSNLTARIDDPAFTVAPASLGLGANESRELRVTYRATDTTPRGATLTLHASDPDTADVVLALQANSPNITVGDPAPDETARLTDGSEWRLADQRGHAVLLTYFASWCPICGIDMPDLEANVWRRYRARGLMVVGIDPPLAAFRAPDTIADVVAFARHAGISFPMGVSVTSTYNALRMGRSDEAAPFPVSLLVDPSGRVSYLGTAISPAALTRAIEDALASAP